MLIELITTRPTAEINGIVGGYTGEGAKTVLPAKAMAKVSFRLVGDQDPVKVREAFRAFVKARLPVDCTAEFANFSDARALQLAFDSPALAKARSALQAEWGKTAVTVGAGGSIPIVGDFKSVLGMDSIMVGFALDDDRVHSPNEKFDLKSFHKGIRSWARILGCPGGLSLAQSRSTNALTGRQWFCRSSIVVAPETQMMLKRLTIFSGMIVLALAMGGCTRCGWIWSDGQSSSKVCRDDVPK